GTRLRVLIGNEPIVNCEICQVIRYKEIGLDFEELYDGIVVEKKNRCFGWTPSAGGAPMSTRGIADAFAKGRRPRRRLENFPSPRGKRWSRPTTVRLHRD